MSDTDLIRKIEENKPKTETKEELHTSPKTLTATGQNIGAGITLTRVYFDSRLQASVFIYPASYMLTQERIESLDPRFKTIPRELGIQREIKDITPEDLSKRFLNEIRPLHSDIDRFYTTNGIRISENVFNNPHTSLYLSTIIKDIKG